MDYARRVIPVGIADLIDNCYNLLATLEREGPAARGQVTLVRRAILDFERDLESMSRRFAGRADTLVKETLDARRVRPERTEDPIRLKDHIVSDPLSLGGLHAGVGVARIEELAKVPWWRTQESGSHHLVGTQLYGYFYGADRSRGSRRAPNPDERRQHPIFQTGKGRRLIIRNPIPAKFYLRDGSAALGVEWRAAFDRIQAELVAKIDTALAGGPRGPVVPRRPRPGPRRR